jgi:hypothetical protein
LFPIQLNTQIDFRKSATMKISSALTTILIQAGFISSLPSSTSRSAVAPPDTSVTVQWAGSGCSGSSGASYVVDPTLTVFNLTTPNLISTSSGSSGPPITRKNCGFILGFSYPAGWQYAVQNEAWSGTANVEAGLTGRTAGHYYFSGDANQVRAILLERAKY